MTKSFLSEIIEPDSYTRRCLSIQIIYQATLLNLSTGDKQGDEVILNPNNYKENIKLHIKMLCMCTFMIHMYIHIRKYRSIKSFYDKVISL